MTKRVQERKAFTFILFVVVLMVFCLSLVTCAYGAWQVIDVITSRSGFATVQAKLVLEERDEFPQHPGADITRSIAVQNIGDVDIFVRVKLSTSFVDGEGGTYEDIKGYVETEYNARNWKSGDDGYYYLIGALAPGDTSADLFDSIMLSTDIPGEYAGYVSLMEPEMEAIQTTSNAVSVAWQKSYEYIEADMPSERETNFSSITFVGPQKGFMYRPDRIEIFDPALDLTPGEALIQEVTFANAYSKKTEITISFASFDESQSSILLAEYTTLLISDETGNIVFNGTIASEEWKAFVKSIVLEANESFRWTVKLAISPDIGNELQGMSVENFAWALTASEPSGRGDGQGNEGPSGIDPSITEPPDGSKGGSRLAKTSDVSITLFSLVVAVISGSVLMMLRHKIKIRR